MLDKNSGFQAGGMFSPESAQITSQVERLTLSTRRSTCPSGSIPEAYTRRAIGHYGGGGGGDDSDGIQDGRWAADSSF
jgi:hypothetical protein